jgi:predicted nucleotidyltransferase
MRLKESHREAVVGFLGEQSGVSGSALFLVGSRADDSKRGGDIDLLWVVPSHQLAQLKARKFELKAVLQEKAEDQRVDLIIADEEALEKDPFLASVFNGKKVLLKSWE